MVKNKLLQYSGGYIDDDSISQATQCPEKTGTFIFN
jgi:hypothetical protein